MTRVVGLVVALVAALTPRAEAQQCRLNCPPSWERDEDGCCVGPRSRPAGPRCEPDEHVSAGHCCPDGHDWVPRLRRCVCTAQGGCARPAPPSAPPLDPPVTPAPVAPAAPAFACPHAAVPIPGGTYWRGSAPGEGEPTEEPQHQVTLPAFCIDRTEVTVARFERCVAAGRCRPAATTVLWPAYSERSAAVLGGYCNGSRDDRRTHPVNCVSWGQAARFCEFAGGALPTEAQWEYAARGADRRIYPWGPEAPDPRRLNACGVECSIAWTRHFGRTSRPMHRQDDGYEGTAPVGRFPAGASAFGLLDMAGNVWEWVRDRHGPYPEGPVVAPSGPPEGPFRVARGGGFQPMDAAWYRAAARHRIRPEHRNSDVGFRCAYEPPGGG